MNLLSAVGCVALVSASVGVCAAQDPQKPVAPPPAVAAPAVPTPAAPIPTPAVPAEGGAQAPAAATPVVVVPDAVAAPVAAPPVQPGPLPAVSANYVLGAEDGISVTVYKEAALSGPLMIRPDGKISIPLVGDVTAAGLTPMALSVSITNELKKFINDPTVTVTVTAVNSKRIYFVGEIGHVGPMALTPDMTLLQAIATAGGLTTYAKNKIYILRGPVGKQHKIPFDYKKALKTGDQQGVTLMAGDTIVVP